MDLFVGVEANHEGDTNVPFACDSMKDLGILSILSLSLDANARMTYLSFASYPSDHYDLRIKLTSDTHGAKSSINWMIGLWVASTERNSYSTRFASMSPSTSADTTQSVKR